MELVVNFEAPAKIDFVNFEMLKKEIVTKLDYYNNLVVSDDSIKEAKADKTKLNALVKAIEDKRKEYKKLCLAPYEDYEYKCKELVSLIQQPISSIDSQIKSFDEIELKNKYAAIESIYNNAIGELRNVVSLESILPPKWKNKTCSLNEIKSAIEGEILNIKSGLMMLDDLKTNHLLQAKDTFLRTRNLAAAMSEAKRLDKMEEELNARNIRTAPIQSETPLKSNENAPQQPVEADKAIIPDYEEETVTIAFRVTTTTGKLKALSEFMKANGIRFGKVD